MKKILLTTLIVTFALVGASTVSASSNDQVVIQQLPHQH